MFWIAIVLGVVEGLTEFLPISSTGHLIITSELLDFEGPRADLFAIFIQLGAILSVVWEFRGKLFGVVRDLPTSAAARGFGWRLAIAFLPAAVLGLAFHDFMQAHLFDATPVAIALIVGALLILIVEALPLEVRTREVERMGMAQAIGVGCAQCLALWPGFSRSAATILGGLGVGLDRRTATEFSFFLAVPTMLGATGYSLFDSYDVLEPGDLSWLGLSFAVSFLVAWAAIRWFLRYVSTHSFKAFAWYRLAVGIVILVWL
jgi:undecaprenyl-diphosphatase